MNELIEHYVLSLTQGPVRRLLISAENDQLKQVQVLFDGEKGEIHCSAKPSPFMHSVIEQLNAYSRKAHNDWSIALPESGTAYQQKVWRYLQTIPLGTTQSYGEIAAALSSSARAVGNACRANPWLLIIPCHRVVKATDIGGFGGQVSGEAIRIKRQLLAHEQD